MLPVFTLFPGMFSSLKSLPEGRRLLCCFVFPAGSRSPEAPLLPARPLVETASPSAFITFPSVWVWMA